MSVNSFSLMAYWGIRAENSERLSVRLARTLNDLRDIHPAFRELDWAGVGVKPRTRRLAELSVAELAPLFRAEREHDEAKKRRFLAGYQFYANRCDEPGQYALLYMFAGADRHLRRLHGFPNDLHVALSRLKSAEDADTAFPALKPALYALLPVWQPEFLKAYSGDFSQRQRGPTDPYPISCGAWMIYLAADRARGVVPPRDAIVERTPDGGLLMMATEGAFDLDNPQHVAAALAIQAAVEPFRVWPEDIDTD
jgi:hypothetical protein